MSENNNTIQVRKDTSLQDWQVIQSVAPVVQASRMFAVTVEQAAVVMLKGRELGLGLAASFEFIHVIDGKPSLSPKGALALIHKSGDLEELRITGDDKSATCYMKRKSSGYAFEVGFTMQDAERAGLVKDKGAWQKYPANMLRWRAVGYCADVVFPDVTGGLIRPEELGANVNADGEPIDAPYTVSKPQPQPQPTVPDIAGLLALFDAARVLAANGGIMPATQAEVAAIVDKLSDEDNAAALVAAQTK